MGRCAVAIRVEPTSQAVFGFPEPSRPGRRIRRILHNIGPFDPDERFITLRALSDRPYSATAYHTAVESVRILRTHHLRPPAPSDDAEITGEPPSLKIRGYAALSLAAVLFSAGDLLQRVVVYPLTRMLSKHQAAILGKWQRCLCRTLFLIFKVVGGANIPRPGKIPGGPGVLILMNHQSILDIPMVLASVDGACLRIVTRARYAKWIPIISHTIRKLEYPLVNPGAKAGTTRRYLEQLGHVARTTDGPLVLYPEGTRTRNGKIGRFQTSALERILAARDWTVYVLVSDGYWRHAKLSHFVGGMQEIDGHLSVLGPIEWNDPEADPEDFIQRMRGLMVEELARIRGAKADLAKPDLAPA